MRAFVLSLLLLSQFSFASRRGAKFFHKDMLNTGDNASRKELVMDVDNDPLIDEYKSMLLGLDEKHQLLMLIKKIPESRDEALELVLREVFLYQQIFQQQIKVIEAMKKNPLEHQELSTHFSKLGFKPWKIYMDAKLTNGWCNLIVRWIGWISRYAKANQEQFDKFFIMLFQPYQKHIFNAESGIVHLLSDIEDRFSPAYTLLLHKCREVVLKAQDSRQTIWFHDNISHSLLFYSTVCHLLVPFISNPSVVEELKTVKKEFSWPLEYEKLGAITYGRITFKVRNGIEPSLRIINEQWSLFCQLEPYRLVTDLWDESVTDLNFEMSYVDPLNLKNSKLKTASPSSTSTNPLNFLTHTPNDKRSARPPKKQQKKRHKASSAPTPSFFAASSEQASSSIDYNIGSDGDALIKSSPLIEADRSEEIVDESPKNFQIKESAPIPINGSAEGGLSSGSCSPNPSPSSCSSNLSPSNHPIESPSSSPVEIFSASSRDTDELSWEELVRKDVEKREKYALERKRKAQADKIIRQEQMERLNSERRAVVRRNLRSAHSSSSKSSSSNSKPQLTEVVRLDSTELCLEFPQAHSLFLSNKNICSIKAKRFRWFFDSNVVIKQDHMNFLCILFDMQRGKLTFSKMIKTYWSIVKCFDLNLQWTQVTKTVFFQWNHHFQINGILVAPTGKEVHPEHESSGFNHTDAMALFSSGGFDPRFFIPLNHANS